MTHVLTPTAPEETAAGTGGLNIDEGRMSRTSIDTPEHSGAAVAEISEALRQLLADVFALYIKTKSFHWHVHGRHFRDYHLLLDEQAGQIFAMTDDIAERARKLSGTTLRSIGDISRHQRLLDNNVEVVETLDMLTELREDNKRLASFLRAAHELCDRHNDVATTSLIENWIDESERRTWFLREILHNG